MSHWDSFAASRLRVKASLFETGLQPVIQFHDTLCRKAFHTIPSKYSGARRQYEPEVRRLIEGLGREKGGKLTPVNTVALC
jgi:hypothetical protein